MAQGKKKRKVADKKVSSKGMNKSVQKVEPKEKSAILNEKRIEETPMEKKRIEVKEVKQKKESSSKVSSTKSKTTKTTGSSKKTTTTYKKKTTPVKKQTSSVKLEEKKRNVDPKATDAKNERKKTVKTEKVPVKKETSKKKTSVTEKKEISSKKTPIKKKVATSKKKATKKEEKKGTPKKKNNSKKIKKATKEKVKNLLTKETWQALFTKIFLFFSIFFKNIKKGAIHFYAFLKIQFAKLQRGGIRFWEFLKVCGNQFKKQSIRFYKFLKIHFKEFSVKVQKWRKRFKERFSQYLENRKIKRENHQALNKIVKENKKSIREAKKSEIAKLEKTKKEEIKETVLPESKQKKEGHPIRTLIILGTLVVFTLIGRGLPYGTKLYHSEASNKVIDVPKFTQLKEECCNFSATFTSVRSASSLKKELERLLVSYQKLDCDHKDYYYNPKGDYTITEYTIKEGIFFNELKITYGIGNSCDIDTTFKKLELLSDAFSIEDAIRDGNYVIYEGKVYNEVSYDQFMKEVEGHNPSTLRIVTTTEEKDVLVTDLEYLKDGKFKVTHDKTRDRHSHENYIMAYKFDHIGVYKNKFYAYNGSLNDVTVHSKNAYYLFDLSK